MPRGVPKSGKKNRDNSKYVADVPKWLIDRLYYEEDKESFRNKKFSTQNVYTMYCPDHGKYEVRLHDIYRARTGEVGYITDITSLGCRGCSKKHYRAEVPDWLIDRLLYEEDKESFRRREFSTAKKYWFNCPKHGPYYILLSDLYVATTGELRYDVSPTGLGCAQCVTGNFPSKAEDIVESWFPEFEVLRNDRSIVKSPGNKWMELDVYIPALALAFECNGSKYHNEEKGLTYEDYIIRNRKMKKLKGHRFVAGLSKWEGYHKWKYERCKELGIELICLDSDEVVRKYVNIR